MKSRSIKTTRLFLERNCPHCGSITAILNMDAMMDDEFRGSDGDELLVFVTQSNEASIEILEKFGLKGHFIPVLQTHDGVVIDKTGEIIHYLKEHGMAAE